MNKKQETFGDFDLARALEYLDLFPYEKWKIDATPVPVSEVLKVNLRRAEKQVNTGSNEWEQRLFMELVFLEVIEDHDLRMWQEKQVDAGESPFKGKADFVFTPYQASFKLPYVVLCEAKKMILTRAGVNVSWRPKLPICSTRKMGKYSICTPLSAAVKRGNLASIQPTINFIKQAYILLNRPTFYWAFYIKFSQNVKGIISDN